MQFQLNTSHQSGTNGTHTVNSYNAGGQILSIQHLEEGTNAISSISYGYNSGDNRTNRAENGIVDTYTYDAIDQITGVSYSTNRTVSYGYDALGSRTNVTDNSVPTTYTANNLNQYTAVDGSSLAYDAKGNLTTGPGSASYTYDGNNRLTSATVGTNSATFTHDARMRNVKRVVDGQTRYFYFGNWSLVQERDGSGNVIQNYVNGSRIDEIIRKTDSGGTVYYHADALGSVVMLTDHTGDVVERYTYDVFGTPTVFDSSLTILTSSLQNNRFLFTGREWFDYLGLYDYRNRIYSPGLGRFLQTDPIRFDAGDANLYRYVGNDPLNWGDPAGLQRDVANDPNCSKSFTYNRGDWQETGEIDYGKEWVRVRSWDIVGLILPNPNLTLWKRSIFAEMQKWVTDEYQCICPSERILQHRLTDETRWDHVGWDYKFDSEDARGPGMA